jgi:hypothetical protein
MGTEEWTDSFVPILLSKLVPVGWASTKHEGRFTLAFRAAATVSKVRPAKSFKASSTP